MIVVVLSVTPERLRGQLTRWLLEISAGVYVGHAPARVRELLWLRIVDDVSRGRALMVWSARGEQRRRFRVHNHAWSVEDFDGLVLVRRQTAESRQLARRERSRKNDRVRGPEAYLEEERATESQSATWSHAGRRRRFRNAIEQRRQPGSPSTSSPDSD